MMKLKSKVVVLLVGVSLLFTGCGSSKIEETSSSSTQEVEKSQVEEKRKKNRADLFGRVKSIIGNEVVLELAEMPQRKAEENAEKPSGEKPENPGAGGGSGQGRKREIKLTGETETILIPVGIQVLSFSRDGEKEIDIADIYEGSMMQIWYDEKDQESKTITKVMIMQGRQ
ncbi:MAG: hypothetical protein N4A62_16480 [Marinisporobacter sp.]|jgi:hypothetical protein|nr:hypothetical protein [Marinisporobacter sp.]